MNAVIALAGGLTLLVLAAILVGRTLHRVSNRYTVLDKPLDDFMAPELLQRRAPTVVERIAEAAERRGTCAIPPPPSRHGPAQTHMDGWPVLVPAYWMHDTEGQLSAAVRAYLGDSPLSPTQFGVMRCYLRPWVSPSNWRDGPDLAELRNELEAMTGPAGLRQWFEHAEAIGIEPL